MEAIEISPTVTNDSSDAAAATIVELCDLELALVGGGQGMAVFA